jgi:hypothetical protein
MTHVDELPNELQKLLTGCSWQEIPVGYSDNLVFRVILPHGPACYLKIAAHSFEQELLAEKERLAWLQGRLPVPAIFAFGIALVVHTPVSRVGWVKRRELSHLTTVLSSLLPLSCSPEAASTRLQGCRARVGSSSVPRAVGWEQVCFDKRVQFVQGRYWQAQGRHCGRFSGLSHFT